MEGLTDSDIGGQPISSKERVRGEDGDGGVSSANGSSSNNNDEGAGRVKIGTSFTSLVSLLDMTGSETTREEDGKSGGRYD